MDGGPAAPADHTIFPQHCIPIPTEHSGPRLVIFPGKGKSHAMKPGNAAFRRRPSRRAGRPGLCLNTLRLYLTFSLNILRLFSWGLAFVFDRNSPMSFNGCAVLAIVTTACWGKMTEKPTSVPQTMLFGRVVAYECTACGKSFAMSLLEGAVPSDSRAPYVVRSAFLVMFAKTQTRPGKS
jgi:hypothetical protein